MTDWLTGPRRETWWTGKQPLPGHCPGVDDSGLIHSLPQLRLQGITRADVLNYFDNSWTMTEVLFSALQGEESFIRAPVHQLRHPLIFYYGHPAVLYVNKLRVAGLLPGPVNAYFENLFEVGVDEMSWDDMSKNEMRWPPLREVTEYRRVVYDLIRQLILQDPRLDPEQNPFTSESPAWSLVMGFEHERIHFETSSVLMREAPLKHLKRPSQFPAASTDGEIPLEPLRLLELAPTKIAVGKPERFPSFGWDNEYGLREHDTVGSRVADRLTSNADFLEFVEAGGYREARFWSSEGWGWRSFRNTKAPTFWVSAGPAGLHKYKIRTLFEEIPFRPSWPAIVNFHEAQAYCAWKSETQKSEVPFRLMTETEHHVLRAVASGTHAWNVNLRHGSEVSVDRYVEAGVYDLYGNAWQWCEDHFHPLPGFRVHPYYEDFSTPCFDGRHHLIMGGSFASTGAEAEPHARFHFRPHFFQHAGFRIAQNRRKTDPSPAVSLSGKVTNGGSDYESSELLSQYLLLHFGKTEDVYPYEFGPREALDFPRRCADLLVEACRESGVKFGRALDVGCAVGGSAFALSEHFSEVTGVDLSASFIATANRLKSGDVLAFDRKDQGELKTRLEARRPAAAVPARVNFHEADACQLPAEMRDYDAVLMANLLCRLPDPRACLRRMSGPNGVVARGGLLVLVSPYSWLEQHTPPRSWLGGKVEGGQASESSSEIQKFLGADFELLKTADLPLVIREHARKYQYIVSHLMIWRRR